MLNNLDMTHPSQTERNWAMLAHLSALLTILVGSYTGGVGVVITLLAPLGLYVYFSGRSRYVAFHALQATVFQALGTVLFVVLVTVVAAGLSVLWVMVGVLSMVLVGVLLLPLALALTFMAAVDLVALPAIWLAYTLRGAYLAYQGEPFEYPGVGPLVARSLAPVPSGPREAAL